MTVSVQRLVEIGNVYGTEQISMKVLLILV